jgi:hypothetical protein
MPTKIKPKYRNDPVQKVRSFSFPEDQIERLFDALVPVKGERYEIIGQLVKCARNYLQLRNQYREKATRAEQNAALKELAQLARGLEMKLRCLDMDTEWELMTGLALFQAGEDPLADLTDRVEHFGYAAKQALQVGKKKSGPRGRTDVHRIVAQLAHLYEATTGRPVSHNPKQKTEYFGSPESPAGRFIVAFFNIVDPNVSPTLLSTAMGYLVRFRKTGTPPTAG